MSTVPEYVELILAAIHEDMSRPFRWGKQIPRDVGSFSALHDFCDANGYAAEYMQDDLSARREALECTCPKNRSLQPEHSDDCYSLSSEESQAAWDAWLTLVVEVENEINIILAIEAATRRRYQDMEPFRNYGREIEALAEAITRAGKTHSFVRVERNASRHDGYMFNDGVITSGVVALRRMRAEWEAAGSPGAPGAPEHQHDWQKAEEQPYPKATVYTCLCGQHNVIQDDPTAHAAAVVALAETLIDRADAIEGE